MSKTKGRETRREQVRKDRADTLAILQTAIEEARKEFGNFSNLVIGAAMYYFEDRDGYMSSRRRSPETSSVAQWRYFEDKTPEPDLFPKEKYSFPVYATQGGGLARYVGDTCIFVEAPPDCMGLSVGDPVPREWSTCAANEAARNEMLDEEFGGREYVDTRYRKNTP
jgi:hypothetical protein